MRKNSKSKDREIEMWKFGKSFPLFSHDESIELLSNMDFVKRANKQLSEEGSIVKNESNDLYYFLQQICEYSGIFVPITMTTKHKGKRSYYLIPLIADQEVPTESWSYKVKDQSMATLCHSFAPSGAIPSGFMDKVAVEVMRNIFEFSFQHSSTSVRIQQVLFWKNAIYIKVIEEIEDENKNKCSCAAEIFVQMAKIDSPHYVGSDDFRKLIVSAKGYAGGQGERIWKQGFSSVLDSIERIANIYVEGELKREIVCPDCLRQTTPINATVWNHNKINYSDDAILCPNGHEPHPQLLLGPFDEMDDTASVATGVNSVFSSFSAYSTYTNTSSRDADVMIPAVVLVALWDKSSNRIINIGSGFIADNKRGLVITASHVLFNFEAYNDNKKKYQPFFGLPNATALIGINHQGNDSAVFTYCADIIASDVYNVDGCVLKIKSKFERPVELDRNYLTHRAEFPISSQSEVKQERLERLVMTTLSPREQQVRVLGYRQTGEGIMVAGCYINRTACVNIGYVCKPAKSNDLQSGNEQFVPRSEIIVNCSTGDGNSGGPFVNELGEVIGILSRTDKIDKDRCYLTAALELKSLLKEARKKCKREKLIFSPHTHF
jgi:S1-C subfamily serine protease